MPSSIGIPRLGSITPIADKDSTADTPHVGCMTSIEITEQINMCIPA